MVYQYDYPRPALTVDIVVFGHDIEGLHVLLIKRGEPPFKGKWAIPGGFVNTDENLEDAAARELKEESGLAGIFLEQLYTFGDVGRDPRERIVTVCYYALTNLDEHQPKADTDAAEVKWVPITRLPSLAFDHQEIFQVALDRLRGKLQYEPIGFELLPKKFSLSQLQSLYEVVWQRQLDKRNFRKKILEMGVLIELDEREKNVRNRPSRLYRFDRKQYEKMRKKGIYFNL